MSCCGKVHVPKRKPIRTEAIKRPLKVRVEGSLDEARVRVQYAGFRINRVSVGPGVAILTIHHG